MERMEGCIFANDRFKYSLIRYLQNREIDFETWDRCIAKASLETLYPYSWYLNLVSPGWGALVKGDYDMIMPLTVSRKYGFHLLLQPILAQQLGVFASVTPGEAELNEFIQAIPASFRYVDIGLNHNNLHLPAGLNRIERANYELDLSEKATSYNTNTKRNLQKGRSFSFEFSDITTEQYLDLKYSGNKKVSTDRQYLENLFDGLTGLERAGGFGLFLNGKIQSAAILGYSETRVIYLNGSTTAAGKENRSMFILMDALIDQSRGNYQVFDFEGSDIPGVARFFEGFGGRKTIYPRIVRTKFPFFRFRG